MPNLIPNHRPSWLPRPEETTSRKEDIAFYKGKAWRNLRYAFLRAYPLCQDCRWIATQVHHVKPRKQFPDLAYSWENLLSLCTSCHSRRTMAEKHETR